MGLAVGQRVGDYEILGILGTGGMGRVYRVRNLLSDRIEAMKVLLPGLIAEPETASRFTAEIRTLASFSHPNIAQLRTAFQVENQLVMIMEFVEGFPVEYRTKRGRIPQDDALNYALQLLSALSYAHTRGVVHRDVKPANLMVTPGGVVKLMDFGICKSEVCANFTRPGIAMGSMHYMSPEQMRGDAVDARSDLYSVGILLYEMLTGRRPFETNDAFSIVHQQLNAAPRPPIEVNPLISKALNDQILRSLAKSAAARFQSAEAFAKALKSLAAQGPQLNPVARPRGSHRAAVPLITAPRRAAAGASAQARGGSVRIPAPVLLAETAPNSSLQSESPSLSQRLGWVVLGALAVVVLAGALIGLPYYLSTNATSTSGSAAAALSGASRSKPSQPDHTLASSARRGVVNWDIALAKAELFQLQSRSKALDARLNRIETDQAEDGSSLNPELRAKYATMHSHLQNAASGLNHRDVASTRREIGEAEKEISTLESTFSK
jgi:serine/threonine-protein kinase